MTDLLILKSLFEIADIHTSRLKKALLHIDSLCPLTPKKLEDPSDENLGFFELLTGRFAKLQDLIGSKIFPQLLKLELEDVETQTQLDRLHKLEKLGLLPSAEIWIDMRVIRNSISHEYPGHPELMCKNLNKVIESAHALVKYWEELKAKMIAKFPSLN